MSVVTRRDAPARVARLAAWIVAFHGSAGDPVPCSPEELGAHGSLAGFVVTAVVFSNGRFRRIVLRSRLAAFGQLQPP